MAKLIEDLSRKVECVNPANGFHYTDYVNLKIMDWGYGHYVAYTFNSDSLNTAKALVEALKKYGKLEFITGVTGVTANDLIQSNVTRHMMQLLGGALDYDCNGKRYCSTMFSLKNA